MRSAPRKARASKGDKPRARPLVARTFAPESLATLADLAKSEGRSQGLILDDAIALYARRAAKLRKCSAPDVGDASKGGEVAAE